ncbi:unnamed protein product, partial [Adineta ricciae]
MAKTNEKLCERLKRKNVIWYYNDQKDEDENENWIPLNDIDNEIVENAFLKNEKQVELDDYLIDLDKMIQMEKDDYSKKRFVKRSIIETNHQSISLRCQRFYTTEKPVQSSEENNSKEHCLISQIQKEFGNLSMNEILHKASNGIRHEGILIGKAIEGEWIANQLELVAEKSIDEIEKCLISLYTRESFLYLLINSTLRQNDQTKLETLGPFISLLSSTDCSSSMSQYGYSQELYRGAQLTDEIIDIYRKSIGRIRTWNAFSSTSQNRKKAECFGNVLFVINRDKSTRYKYSGMNVSSISQYPDEEEVLIRASRNFRVENVEKDDNS